MTTPVKPRSLVRVPVTAPGLAQKLDGHDIPLLLSAAARCVMCWVMLPSFLPVRWP